MSVTWFLSYMALISLSSYNYKHSSAITMVCGTKQPMAVCTTFVHCMHDWQQQQWCELWSAKNVILIIEINRLPVTSF